MTRNNRRVNFKLMHTAIFCVLCASQTFATTGDKVPMIETLRHASEVFELESLKFWAFNEGKLQQKFAGNKPFPDSEDLAIWKQYHRPSMAAPRPHSDSEARMLALRQLIEAEDLSPATIQRVLRVQMDSQPISQHRGFADVKVFLGRFLDAGADRSFPIVQAMAGVGGWKTEGAERLAGFAIPHGYTQNLQPVFGPRPKSSLINRGEWDGLTGGASALQYPMDSYGFDGLPRMVMEPVSRTGTVLLVIPEREPYMRPRRSAAFLEKVFMSSDGGAIPPDIWLSKRYTVGQFMERFVGRPGWQMTVAAEGQFLFEAERLKHSGAGVAEFEATVGFGHDRSQFDREAQRFLRKEIYQTGVQLMFRGQRGIWRLDYQPLFEPTAMMEEDWSTTRIFGQWELRFEPYHHHRTYPPRDPAGGKTPLGQLELVNGLLNSNGGVSEWLKRFGELGVRTSLLSAPTNRPARISYQLDHSLLRAGVDGAAGASNFLFESGCQWQNTPSTSPKVLLTANIQCSGLTGRSWISLQLNPLGSCLSKAALLKSLQEKYRVEPVRDFYRDVEELHLSDFRSPLWSIEYRGSRGKWQRPYRYYAEVAAGRGKQLTDQDVRLWAMAYANTALSLKSKSTEGADAMLGLWESKGCIELIQMVRATKN